MPRFPKPPARRQGHRASSPALQLSRGSMTVPAPVATWLRATRAAWEDYWTSDDAKMTRPAQLPMIRRLFARYDERERAYRTVTKVGRCVAGSKGQPVLNPLIKYIDSCDAEIRQLEDRLGLSPRGFAQLGSHFAAVQKSLDDLGAGADDDEVDPRAPAPGTVE